jgi:predicted ArsR family transcriptional regulator
MILLDKGIVLPQKVAAAMGMSPMDFQRQLDEARATGFVDNLTPIISAFQQSPNAGRPPKPESDLGDAGEQTKGDGSNIGRGGKNK